MDELKDLLSYGILMKPTSYSKLQLAIEELISEEWFRELYRIPSYNSAVWKDKTIKNILIDPQKVKLIKQHQNYAMEFINLVKESAK
ncbi:hypothetical protein [Priestia megaterium]|uniref:hypothetical protein n=1 Tax=Priestia megaterium TaxID=1404 RepID=UPI002042190B|nr:hypothetical protein [Priestia megaterium]MCM3183686.1 hypothetical protein [Priestia megaterium]